MFIQTILFLLFGAFASTIPISSQCYNICLYSTECSQNYGCMDYLKQCMPQCRPDSDEPIQDEIAFKDCLVTCTSEVDDFVKKKLDQHLQCYDQCLDIDDEMMTQNTNKIVQLSEHYYKNDSPNPMILSYFIEKNYEVQEEDPFSQDYYIKFVQTSEGLQFDYINKQFHLVNQIDRSSCIEDKQQLINTLAKMDVMKVYDIKSTDILPDSYVVNINSDDFTQEEMQVIKLPNPNNLWFILKPQDKSQGMGIKMVKNLTHFQEHYEKRKVNYDRYKKKKKAFYILQRYIMDPLLIEGKKFDLRQLVIIPTVSPFSILTYGGYIRRSLFGFNLDVHTRKDDAVHVTNYNLQKTHAQFENQIENLYWNFEKFNDYLNYQKKFSDDQIKKMYYEMQKCITYTMLAGKLSFKTQIGQFQFFAVDFIIDSNLRPWMIEVDNFGSFEDGLMGKNEYLQTYFTNAMDLVIDLHENIEEISENVKNLDKKVEQYNGMDIIYNEATGYNILNQ